MSMSSSFRLLPSLASWRLSILLLLRPRFTSAGDPRKGVPYSNALATPLVMSMLLCFVNYEFAPDGAPRGRPVAPGPAPSRCMRAFCGFEFLV